MSEFGTWMSGLLKDAGRKLDFATLDQTEESEHGAKMDRSLQLGALVFMVIANVIGAGIFVTTGTVAHDWAGPSVVLSYALAGLVAVLAALCYAEMAGRVRGNGSAASYAYATMGELVGFLIGFDLLLEVAIGSAAVATGWADNLSNLLWICSGVHIPDTWFGFHFNIAALAIVVVATAILLLGVNHTARATTALVLVKLGVLLVFVAIAGWHYQPANMHPFTHPVHGAFGTFKAAAVVFFAFVGFECVTAGAGECKNPQRDLPRAIMWGVAVCAILYMLTSLAMVGAVHFSQLGGTERAAPMAKVLTMLGCSWGAIAVSIGSLISLSSVLLVGNYGLTRIARSLARFGLLPAFLGKLHERTKVPVWTTIISGVVVGLAAALLPIEELAELCNIGTLAAFTLVCLSVVFIRAKHPEQESQFKCPGYPFIPILGAISCLGMMAFLPALSWMRFIGWMSIALVWYCIRGRFSSRLNDLHDKQSAVVTVETAEKVEAA